MSDSQRFKIVAVEQVEPRRHFAAGFTASYFPTTTFTGTAATQTDAAIAFSFYKNAPARGIPATAFSARWTAAIDPAVTGRHAVYVTTEGSVRVWINHTLVLNKPAARGVATNYKIVTTLTAGTAADIQIEYRHDGGRGKIGVTWVEPGGNKQVLQGASLAARTPALLDQIDHARTFAADQMAASVRSLSVKKGFPTRSDPASPAWLLVDNTDWTSGTFSGAMWELNQTFAGWNTPATTWAGPLATTKIVGDAFDREWAAFKPLADAGDAAAKKVLLASAALKMTAWSKTVRAFKTPELVSHSGNANANFGVLMDQTMDMDELLWAGQQTGDTSYRDRVIAHMQTVATNMVRIDGSVSQRAYFDSSTGKLITLESSQGYSDTSTWSRGQAWAINSFADVAAATGDATLLATAKKVANYFISHTPADGVPYWDFQAPGIPKTYRDTSAAAIAAGGLLKLSTIVDARDRATYRAAAAKILTSLTSSAYLAEGTALKGVLQHGAGNVPKNKGADSDLMFGDYYLLQAMNRFTSAS